MKKALLYCFVLLNSIVFAQQSKIDSLKKILVTVKSDTSRANIFEQLAKEIYYTNIEKYKSNIDSVIFYARRSKSIKYSGIANNLYGRYYQQLGKNDKSIEYYKLSVNNFKKTQLSKQLAMSYGNVGGVFLNEAKFDSASYYIKKAIKINESIKSNDGLFYNYFNLSVLESSRENSKLSINYILKALSYANKLNDKRFISYCYSQLGVLYINNNLYDAAEKNSFKSLTIFKEINDINGIANQYNNLGKVYCERDKNYEKAIEYYKIASENYIKVKNDRDLSTCLANIGRNYTHLNNLFLAENYLRKALPLSITTQQIFETGRIYQNLGEIEFKKRNFENAIKNVENSIKIANENNLLEVKADGLILLSDIYNKKGNYKNAYLSYSKGKRLLDSLKTVEKSKLILDIETKYQTEKKEKENLKLKQENTQKKLSIVKHTRDKTILAIGLIGLLIITSIIYLFYKKTKKQKELTEIQKNEIEKQKETIENLQKFLHHENKNNLSRISAFIDVAKNEITDQKIISKLNETQGRLQSIYEVHSQLYLSENLSNINFKNYIDKLVKSVQHTHDKNQVEIINNISENLKISTEIIFSLGLIVNELITNSFKHAFSSKKNPQIFIDLKQVNNKYVLEFLDNGNGLPQNFDIKNLNSYGFELIKILTKELNGTLKMENINGLQINIEF